MPSRKERNPDADLLTPDDNRVLQAVARSADVQVAGLAAEYVTEVGRLAQADPKTRLKVGQEAEKSVERAGLKATSRLTGNTLLRTCVPEVPGTLLNPHQELTQFDWQLRFLREASVRSLLTFLVIVLILNGGFPIRAQQGTTGSQTPAVSAASLQIVILEGEGGINNIKLRTAREVIVQVEDENHRPVAGAAFSAFLPNEGASGNFATGGQIFYGTTADNGQVKFTFRPNKVQGKYQIRLGASFQGQTVAGVVAQTNILSVAAAAVGLGVAAKVLIIVGVAAGAAAGASVALSHSGSSSAPSSPTPSTITIGAGSGPVIIGPPH